MEARKQDNEREEQRANKLEPAPTEEDEPRQINRKPQRAVAGGAAVVRFTFFHCRCGCECDCSAPFEDVAAPEVDAAAGLDAAGWCAGRAGA